MEEQILRDILQEMKGMRQEQTVTNQEMKGMRQELAVTNDRLEKTVDRLDKTVNRLDGVFQSMQVIQQGFSDMRHDINTIKEFLSTKVIWSNDTIAINTKEGEVIEGIISSRRADL